MYRNTGTLEQTVRERVSRPWLEDEDCTYVYIQHNNLYILALCRNNANAVALLTFLHRLVDIFKHYFKVRLQASDCLLIVILLPRLLCVASLAPTDVCAGILCVAGAGGGKYPRQLRHHLRAAGRGRILLRPRTRPTLNRRTKTLRRNESSPSANISVHHDGRSCSNSLRARVLNDFPAR